MRWIVASVVSASVLVAACNSAPEPRPVAPDPSPGSADPMPTPVAVAPPTAGSAQPDPVPVAGPPPPAASPNGDVIVIAKLTNAGPIGDGKCSQRSYEIAIDRVVAGDVPTPKDKRWVHFETCGPRESKPNDLAGTGLDVGSTYKLTLHAGVSKNFGDGLMILVAERP